jgi:hypothetical protein
MYILRGRRRVDHRGDDALGRLTSARLPLLGLAAHRAACCPIIVAFGDWRPQQSLVSAAPMALILAL